jgi:acetyl-CoA C-acetyltransferase
MSDVVIAGIGMIPAGEFWELSLRSLAARAIVAARRDAPELTPQTLIIGNALASVKSHQANLGGLIADNSGLYGVEGPTIEASGASGGAALRAGYMAVFSGMVKTAIVLGVEKVTDQVGSAMDPALTESLEGDYEVFPGLTPSGQAGLLMQRYMHQFEVPEDAFAPFSMNAHANAKNNPNAMYRRTISLEEYCESDMISDPVRMLDVAPTCDGAAAVIITLRENLPAKYPHPLVRISGSNVVTDTLALHDRPDPLAFQAAQLSTQRACRQAGITPRDVDLFELDDAYSIYAALSLETAGYTRRGEGWRLAENGAITLNGELPICTMGGSKARGNCLGATGIYQVAEAVLQLRGEAGKNQVKNARRAMTQCFGGPASTVATQILERIDPL